MTKTFQIVFLTLVTLSISLSVYAIDLDGVVEISEKGKSAAKKEYEDAVIYFVPSEVVSNNALVQTSKEMKMEKKKFTPRVLAVTVGSEVIFPNYDPILHNAFSTSTNNNFDLGLYSGGESGKTVFDKTGLVRVYCNVHHGMVAYILVFDNPYFTNLSSDGSFKLENLPASNGTLYIWHPRAKVLKKDIDINSANSGETYNIKLTKRRIPKHTNKAGKSYRKARKRDY